MQPSLLIIIRMAMMMKTGVGSSVSLVGETESFDPAHRPIVLARVGVVHIATKRGRASLAWNSAQ
jgi:hypothetical protein